jgi:hypothetical protein
VRKKVNAKLDSAVQDKADAEELYRLLEEKIVPLYYDRDLSGLPHGWIDVVKETIRSNAPMFSARRMIKEYIQQMYWQTARVIECPPYLFDLVPLWFDKLTTSGTLMDSGRTEALTVILSPDKVGTKNLVFTFLHLSLCIYCSLDLLRSRSRG